ncbi:putative enzyme [Thiomonas sp. X19]|uniref:RIP metalloprotease RseP n=1 Tax=Thiomonas sp. X19 TaxID=1050370 RepID=UPI000B75B89C|nr:RIP metalloprotease RseP [Thiomonas sp. X19]SCC95020.1 putative enzyme [Thiomonas sp. X19]
MVTVLAFLFALGLLIAIHEYGHYRVAVAAGVKVLRFSIGFGKPLLKWKRGPDQTEFVIAAIPLGGFVRMVDEREGDVPAADVPRAFNRQSLFKRAAIVAAGPAANLLLAVALFAVVAFVGVRQPVALLGDPAAGSPAAVAGVRAGDQVVAITADGSTQTVQSWSDLQLQLLTAAMDGKTVSMQLRAADGATSNVTLHFAGAEDKASQPDFLATWGLRLKSPPALIRETIAGDPAEKAGMRAGDVVTQVDGKAISGAEALLKAIQASAGKPLQLLVKRGQQNVALTIRPQVQHLASNGQRVWRIGAMLGGEIPTVVVKNGPLGAVVQGFSRTWELSALTLKTLGKMVIGQASLSNLSGPVTIADYAGRSAELGWLSYISFLAIISVSLGVLNLLPLPVLDGGHLLYYAIEGFTRRSIPQRLQERLQQGGLVIIALMMTIALYNDFARLIGPMH